MYLNNTLKTTLNHFKMKEKTKISAEIVADSTDSRGNRLTSLIVTFPRIILSELLTHRMLSKNTSSSRAIPFKKMVESVENDPFTPIAWQKNHKGMQGVEYITDETDLKLNISAWLRARDNAVSNAGYLNHGVKEGRDNGVTKQLCNRLLEPFMWTTMLITGSKEGWDNFFELRCPSYDLGDGITHKSKKDALKYISHNNLDRFEGLFITETDWLLANKGQAEIHIMDLAEKIYDAMNENTPKQLKEGEWHIPFEDKIGFMKLEEATAGYYFNGGKLLIPSAIAVSTAMAARTSYTVVGDEKEINYERMLELHDKLIEMRHDSPLEHCARAMSDREYNCHYRGYFPIDGSKDEDKSQIGWCRNYKGFTQYRHIIEDK